MQRAAASMRGFAYSDRGAVLAVVAVRLVLCACLEQHIPQKHQQIQDSHLGRPAEIRRVHLTPPTSALSREMKVYLVAVSRHQKPPVLLAVQHDLSSFSFFQRGSVAEGMNFFVSTIVERTQPGGRQTVEQSNYTGHVYCRQDGLAACVICDSEYPQRTAFTVVAKILDEFTAKFPPNKQAFGHANTAQMYPELAQHLIKMQDPASQDPFMKVQKELDETKIVLVIFVDSAQDHGEFIAARREAG